MAVVRLLQFRFALFLSLTALLANSGPVLSEQSKSDENSIVLKNDTIVPGYVARIDLNDPQEVTSILQRAESYYIENDFMDDLPPIVFVLHGPEVQIFNRNNYFQYKPIVDLAARLSAFRVMDIRVCETQMRLLGEKEEFLYPFVGTVPFGPAEIERLIEEENYSYF